MKKANLKRPKHINVYGMYVDPDFYIIDTDTDQEILSAVSKENGVMTLTFTDPESNDAREETTFIPFLAANIEDMPTRRDFIWGVEPPNPDDVFHQYFHDFFKYNQRGKLIRAFPTCFMLIVDEGHKVATRKLFDNLYGVNGLISVDVHRSREQAASTAVITISDVFRTLQGERGYPPDSGVIKDELDAPFWVKREHIEELVKERAKGWDALDLKAGARIHLRLGYGSNVLDFPVAFNGTIAEIQIGDIVQIIAQGDGLELANALHEEENNRSRPTPREARGWIVELLTGRHGLLKEWFRTVSDNRWFDTHRYNITHFGRMNYPASTNWKEIMDYDLPELSEDFIRQLAETDYIAIRKELVRRDRVGFSGWVKDLFGDAKWFPGEIADNIYLSNGLIEIEDGQFKKIYSQLPQGVLGWLDFALSFGMVNPTDQLNIRLYTENKSLWDIFQDSPILPRITLRLFIPLSFALPCFTASRTSLLHISTETTSILFLITT